MTPAIKIIIADDFQDMREMIEKMFLTSELNYEVIGLCSNGAEVLELLKRKKADIVLMDINMPEMNGLDATQVISDQYPRVSVIMMSVQHESEYLKKAMFAGAKAYIMKPIDIEELIETVSSTYDRYKSNDKADDLLSSGHDTRIISFFSAKGGVGKSLLALNSALLIHEKMKKRVLLIDLDMQFGDIALMVNKQNELTIKDLIDDSPIECFDDIEPYLYKFKENCDMLFAPKDPESAEYISKENIKNIIENVKKHYDVIIVDTGVNYNDITIHVLDQSDQIVIVSNLEVTGLKNTKLSLKVMQSLNYDTSKVKIVINMAHDKFGVTKSNVQKAFNFDVIAYIPEEIKLIRNSINAGMPVVITKNNSIIKPILSMCQALIKD